MASRDGTLTIYTSVDTSGLNGGIKSITRQMNKLAASFKYLVGFTGLLTIGKQAIQSASDLEEYTNVAEKTFKSLMYQLEEFKKTSIEVYGMSELTVTKVASGYMAMGNSIGIANEEASNMAITLTGLVGDFASFYNLSHERARTALAAVYTGETETMKQYGIMLQDVNLQQYENEHQLGRSVATMTAVEKTLLRYNYVLHATSDAQGDFAATSTNWSNQVRLLKEQFTQLLNVLGKGLIIVLKPIVKMLNTLIYKFTQLLNVVMASLGTIFGFDWNELSYGQGNIEDAIEGQEDLADATDDAANAAKKALAPWDDLNVLQSSDTGSGDSDVNLDTSVDVGDFEDVAQRIEDAINSPLNTLGKLGDHLGTLLKESIQSIDWNSVYNSAKNFGIGLADFLNGLISPELFYELGKLIANSLNTALHAVFSFGVTFDWANFGLSIAEGINGYFGNFDYKLFADSLNVFVNGLLLALGIAIINVDWGKILLGIVEFLSNLDPTVYGVVFTVVLVGMVRSAIKMFTTIAAGELTNQLAKAIKLFLVGSTKKGAEKVGFFSMASTFITNLVKNFKLAIPKFIMSLQTMFSGGLISGLQAGASAVVTTVGTFLQGVFGSLVSFITAPITLIVAAVGLFIAIVIDLWNTNEDFRDRVMSTWQSISDAISSVYENIIKPIGQAFVDTFNIIWKYGLEPLVASFDMSSGNIGKAFGAVYSVVKYVVELVVSLLLGIIDIIAKVVKFVSDNFGWLITLLYEKVLKRFGYFVAAIIGFTGEILEGAGIVITAIFTLFEGLIKFFLGVFMGDWQEGVELIKKAFGMIVEPMVKFAQAIGTGISKAFSALASWVLDRFNSIFASIKYVLNAIGTHFSNICTAINNVVSQALSWLVQQFKNAWQAIQNAFSTVGRFFGNVWSAIKNVFSVVGSWFKTQFQNAWQAIQNVFSSVGSFFSAVWRNITNVFSGVGSWFRTQFQNAWTAITSIFNGLQGFFQGVWNGIKSVFSGVASWFGQQFSSAWQAVQNVFSAGGSIFSGITAAIASVLKTQVNRIIYGLNVIISSSFNGLNSMLNTIKNVNILGMSPFYGLWGYNPIPVPQIPYLAKGAVIPPNREFMAVLGDQKHGTNIEAPLDTIVQAMRLALASDGNTGGNDNGPQTIELKIDSKVFARLTLPSTLGELKRKGYNVAVLEG